MSNPELIVTSNDDWRTAFIQNFLLFGYWLLPSSFLHSILRQFTRKSIVIGFFQLIISSLMITWAIQGMLDGPEVLHQYLQGNFSAWSKFLLSPAYITFLMIFSLVLGIGILLPWILLSIMNHYLPAHSRYSQKIIWIMASYSMLSILFYSPLLFLGWIYSQPINPQLIHLLDTDFWNIPIYLLCGIIGFSLIGLLRCLIQLYKINKF